MGVPSRCRGTRGARSGDRIHTHGTVYGRGATATNSYLCHHILRRISNAIVTADAESIAAEADKRIRIAEPLGDLPTTAADAGC